MDREPEEFSIVSDLAEVVLARIARLPHPLVGIDGVEEAGKSHLAERLARDLSASVVDVDAHVEDYRREHLTRERLAPLAQAIALAPPPVIVEGVCLLRVVETLGLHLAALVYVKRIGPLGVWYDEAACDSGLAPDALVERERAASLAIAETEAFLAGGDEIKSIAARLSPRSEAVLRYHAEHRPAHRAHFVFNRPAGAA